MIDKDAPFLKELALVVTGHVGHRIETLSMQGFASAVSKLLAAGRTRAQLLQLAFDPRSDVSRALIDAVSVGETYFFRHPEHFELVIRQLAPRLASEHPSAIRVWCAGCATGEEAYSWAAALVAERGARARPEVTVIGTDVCEAHLLRARGGQYGAWSFRASGPAIVPAVVPVPEGWQVTDEVAAVCQFVRHNLLEPWVACPELGAGPFDLISCRNVLIYMTREGQQRALENLMSALRPGGVLVFSTVDLNETPPGLTRVSAPELNVFVKSAPVEPQPKPPRPTPVVAAPVIAVRPIEAHTRALHFIEVGAEREAMTLLDDLVRQAPDYVPGLLERSLHAARTGEHALARKLMHAVLELTQNVADGTLIAGPQPMPASFYRTSAQAFLSRPHLL